MYFTVLRIKVVMHVQRDGKNEGSSLIGSFRRHTAVQCRMLQSKNWANWVDLDCSLLVMRTRISVGGYDFSEKHAIFILLSWYSTSIFRVAVPRRQYSVLPKSSRVWIVTIVKTWNPRPSCSIENARSECNSITILIEYWVIYICMYN